LKHNFAEDSVLILNQKFIAFNISHCTYVLYY